MLAAVLTWIGAHWGLLIGILFAVGTLLNAATKVWHESAGLAKVALFFTSVFSIVKSSGSEPGRWLGNLKLPLIPEGKAAVAALPELPAASTTTPEVPK